MSEYFCGRFLRFLFVGTLGFDLGRRSIVLAAQTPSRDVLPPQINGVKCLNRSTFGESMIQCYEFYSPEFQFAHFDFYVGKDLLVMYERDFGKGIADVLETPQ